MRLLLRSCYQCLVLHNILTMKPSSAFSPTSVRAASSKIPAAAAAAPKEICETQIAPTTGQASILCTISNKDSPRSSLWSDVAINAAKQFTITQRQKLQDLGALDIERPVKILGRSLSEECDLGDCVLSEEEKKVEDDERMMMDGDTKIIHFQRHGQGKNWICLLQQIILYSNIYIQVS